MLLPISIVVGVSTYLAPKAMHTHMPMRMQVLRLHKDTLMTCAETFLHDPLVEWVGSSGSGRSSKAAGQVGISHGLSLALCG
jgi:hypothetical protein